MRKIHPAIRFLCIVLALVLVCMGAMEFFGLVASLPRRLLAEFHTLTEPSEPSGSAPTGRASDLSSGPNGVVIITRSP